MLEAQKTIAAFNRAAYCYNIDCLLVKKLRAGGLNDEQIAAALTALQDTCPQCWDNDRGCQCSNDE